MSNVKSYPVQVELTLKRSQEVGYNKWKVTLNKEERLVTNKRVVYYAVTPMEAAESFEPEEVEEVVITVKYSY